MYVGKKTSIRNQDKRRVSQRTRDKKYKKGLLSLQYKSLNNYQMNFDNRTNN